jgi:Flp pilus assembly protein TadG
MFAHHRRGRRDTRRRAVVAVQVAVALLILLGFAALTVDVGLMYNNRADLQRTADAAAHAAAARLADWSEGPPIEFARQAAVDYVSVNKVFGQNISVDEFLDVEFGHVTYDVDLNEYVWYDDEEIPNAVRVVVRKSEASGNDPVNLIFAQVLGFSTQDVLAKATAMMVPRDMCIVADLSGSHTDDSEFAHANSTQINIQDVWAAFPAQASSVLVDDAGYESEVEVQDNGDGTVFVNISLTSDGDEGTPALSHFCVGLPEDAWSMAEATASSSGGWPVETGTDPKTGVSGLKYDETELGEDGVVETATFSFMVPEDALGQMVLGTKSGNGSAKVVHQVSLHAVWGRMNTWGLPVDDYYEPEDDPGLHYLPYDQKWSDSELETYLYDVGYCASEVYGLTHCDFDPDGAWKYRVAVALGLAHWNSGHPGGLWERRGVPPSQTGNGNNFVGSSEIDWQVTFGDRSLNDSRSVFYAYIDRTKSTSSGAYRYDHGFRYRFGLKGFINYLLESRPEHHNTPELADTPTQPMQAVKDATGFLTSLITQLQTDDKLSLEIYGTTARHEVDLTYSYSDVFDRLNAMQAGHYDTWTNMGGGLERAIEELDARGRSTSRKMIILLTDGYANVNRQGGAGDYAGGRNYALEVAQEAADLGIVIFAVSVGTNCDQSLMDQIADIGHGEHFHAEGSIEEYSAQLAEYFQILGGRRPIELIE